MITGKFSLDVPCFSNYLDMARLLNPEVYFMVVVIEEDFLEDIDNYVD